MRGTRRKSIIVTITLLAGLYLVFQLGFYDVNRFIPLQVLDSIDSEATRLLRFFNSKHYQCNYSVVIGNRSVDFPICLDNNSGIVMDKESPKGIFYSIGMGSDDEFLCEQTLAHNYSFPTYIISHSNLPEELLELNNTHLINTILVPNDYADFARNSYGQHTLNDIMKMLRHSQLDILKLWEVASPIKMWEVLHFMIADGLLANVKQLHIHLYLSKIDEELLYNWYRTIYNLFYQANFRLYHVSSNSPLCLQVTMMESCAYYLSWIQDPGPKTFVMHPPADMGTQELERRRLIDFIYNREIKCHKVFEVEHLLTEQKVLVTPVPARWHMCVDEFYKHKCTLYSFSHSGNQRVLEKAIKEDLNEVGHDCKIHHYIPKTSHQVEKDRSFEHIDFLVNKNGQEMSAAEVFEDMSKHEYISIVEINMSTYASWHLLSSLLDGGTFANTSQVLIKVFISEPQYGDHPTVLRQEYSILKRMEANGFLIFYSSPCSEVTTKRLSSDNDVNCYKIGFAKTEKLMFHG